VSCSGATDVARYALDNTDLGGEVREVSVLFIDIKGSTALAERLSPDRVVAMLNDLFTAVVAAVEAEGGWINKFEGDAALCIFGAPLPQPDHAGHALAAALRLGAELEQLGRRHPASTPASEWPAATSWPGHRQCAPVRVHSHR
jgi:adenylate cyclase